MRSWETFLKVEGWKSEYISVDRFLKHYSRKVKSEKTRENVCHTLKGLCRFSGKNPDFLASRTPEIASKIVQDYVDSLAEKGYNPESISTKTTCTLSSLKEGGFKITKLHLDVTGIVPDIDDATFKEVAREAEQGCPVANAFRGCVELEVVASLQ